MLHALPTSGGSPPWPRSDRAAIASACVVAAALLAACPPTLSPAPAPEPLVSPNEHPDLLAIVTDAESGAPLPGAAVVAWPGGRDAIAGPDGAARFASLARDSYLLQARAVGYLPSAPVERAHEAGAPAVVFVLEPAREDLCTLRGVVTRPGEDRLPLVGAAVLVDGVAVATSGADGAWKASGLAPGTHVVRFEPPAASTLQPWESGSVDIAPGQGAVVSAALPGSPPAGAGPVSMADCSECHEEIVASAEQRPHGRFRSPAETEVDGDAGLVDAFADGATVALDPAVLGATVALARSGPGAWTAVVADAAGNATPPLPIAEVYGGALHTVALAAVASGTWVTLPLAWSLPSNPSPASAGRAGWTAAWTEGWFDAAGSLSLDAWGVPLPEASFDLRCAGCHAAGASLEQDTAQHFSLQPQQDGGTPLRRPGCEICHGFASAHAEAADDGDPDAASLVFDPGRMPAAEQARACAGCHERRSNLLHPFPVEPGWPVDALGAMPDPWTDPDSVSVPAPDRFAALPVSRLHRDQAGDLAASPHRRGPEGWQGGCTECHDPHGGPHDASLRVPPGDNGLCTACHRDGFAGDAAEAAHSGHLSFEPGDGPGSCAGCHMPRSGRAARPDPVSGTGESRSHALLAWEPALALAEFDLAGADELPLGQPPVAACLDCHLQARDAYADQGATCPCPAGDPSLRQTFVDQQLAFEAQREDAQ